MTNEEKNRIDAIELLRKAQWESFDKRRSYEWKIGIALWTAIASFIVITIKSKITYNIRSLELIIASIIFVIIIIIHAFWIWDLRRANKLDKDIAIFFRDTIMEKITISFPVPIKEQIDSIDKKGRKSKILSLWSHIFQLVITLIFILLAVISLLIEKPCN